MSGKKYGIEINPKRFKNALNVKNLSLSNLGKIAEEEYGIITKRTIQRNLQDKHMQAGVLDQLCDIMDVSPTYITGEDSILFEDYLKNVYMDPRIVNPKDQQAALGFLKAFNASRKDPDGYYIPEYLFMDAKQKYETMQDALITYLVMRQIPYRGKKENEPVFQILSEDYFVENYPAIERVVFTAVTDFVNRN